MLVNTPIPIINFRTNSDFPGSKLPPVQWAHVAKYPEPFSDAEYSQCARVSKPVLVPFDGDSLALTNGEQVVVLEGVNYVVTVIDDVLVQTSNHDAERAYWLQDKLRDAIYGQVRYGTILQKMSSPIQVKLPATNNDDDSSSSEDQQHTLVEWIATHESLAIKEMSWEHIRTQGPELAEDPIKEVSAMQYLNRWVEEDKQRQGAIRMLKQIGAQDQIATVQNLQEKQDENHILMPLDLLSDDDHLYSITPFCTGGRLLDLLESKNRFSEPETRYWMKQILKGLSCLKKAGVVHRDMSPENLMVHGDNVYIIDMGMCLRIPSMDDDATTDNHRHQEQNNGQRRSLIMPQSACGKWYYLSPEVLLSEQPFDGPAVDLWAAGVMLFIMLTGLPPWEEPKMTDENFKLMTTGYLMQILTERRVGLSEDAMDLLQRMFWVDPADRLSLEQVCAHPWMTHKDNFPLSENDDSGSE